MREVAPAHLGGVALGRIATTAGACAAAGRVAAGRDRRARDATRHGRRRAAPLRPRRPALQALQSIYGIGPILACHLLAEIGEACRFSRAEQITGLAGLDRVVDESGDTRRRGHLAGAGSPQLRWALVEAAVYATQRSAPDFSSTRRYESGGTPRSHG